jgi:hypothetical protein
MILTLQSQSIPGAGFTAPGNMTELTSGV